MHSMFFAHHDLGRKRLVILLVSFVPTTFRTETIFHLSKVRLLSQFASNVPQCMPYFENFQYISDEIKLQVHEITLLQSGGKHFVKM